MKGSNSIDLNIILERICELEERIAALENDDGYPRKKLCPPSPSRGQRRFLSEGRESEFGIHVTNIDAETSQTDLVKYFSKFGLVLGLQTAFLVNNPNRLAWINIFYEKEADYRSCRDSAHKRLRIERYIKKK